MGLFICHRMLEMHISIRCVIPLECKFNSDYNIALFSHFNFIYMLARGPNRLNFGH